MVQATLPLLSYAVDRRGLYVALNLNTFIQCKYAQLLTTKTRGVRQARQTNGACCNPGEKPVVAITLY